MSKDVTKSGKLGGSKLITGYRNRDLFKRRFYMNVGIMCRAHSGQPGVTYGTFEQCCIARIGGF
jgi:hypothetical protein